MTKDEMFPELLAALKSLHNGCKKPTHDRSNFKRWKGDLCKLIEKAEKAT